MRNSLDCMLLVHMGWLRCLLPSLLPLLWLPPTLLWMRTLELPKNERVYFKPRNDLMLRCFV